MVDLLHPYEKLKLSVKVMFTFLFIQIISASTIVFLFSYLQGIIPLFPNTLFQLRIRN